MSFTILRAVLYVNVKNLVKKSAHLIQPFCWLYILWVLVNMRKGNFAPFNQICHFSKAVLMASSSRFSVSYYLCAGVTSLEKKAYGYTFAGLTCHWDNMALTPLTEVSNLLGVCHWGLVRKPFHHWFIPSDFCCKHAKCECIISWLSNLLERK